ncbi:MULTISPECIES: aminotransferase class I/II-fold pyridoxal phosphate-dependent enzyme [unclassified Microbacterium]|uniref:aminotransferase class I/II-fold pyridoxal phosphate-dependent enzyme n=1 Tax=unclassified Microbacterium TaxID=2609290 RepID=UPI00214B3F29|nr:MULTISPECIES: aminotransferase class I/II-fold pyridoxal phosphate-dependent enzyme [unclassified Microbacterium]MCR2785656.1 aminotransferase class I/II-fold pyridoxal phosphate-dependent enzyme [Microbacterium sp. zg.B96]WIM17359.1 aminotransferase class I/II-fold pyridoxal phosphate-dependent enzyme [Microbacterium sp. zg-B96]
MENTGVDESITGASAAEIAESIRDLVDSGRVSPGDALPSVRALADRLGVNRNTVVAAYRLLGQAGLVASLGRGGTRVAAPGPMPAEGYAQNSVLRDVGDGNPDPALIPDLSHALAALGGRPVLYGEPVIDPDLERWARAWMAPDVADPDALRVTVTGGAVDAMERLLAQALVRDDAVAMEDPCFLSSIRTVRLGGYRPVAVPVDEEGMTVEGLRAALAEGVRAVICTPRAQNPTGVSLSARRAADLREVMAEHPHVLVIIDDHSSLLTRRPYHSIIGPTHRRWALVRSVSKFLGPDMCLAILASDPDTADRLAMRLSPGSTWVSHLLQRLTVALVTDPDVMAAIDAAGEHYLARNRAFADRLTAHGVPCAPGDGLSLWVEVGSPARAVTEQLMRRGWLARPGDEFVLADESAAHRLRLTVHTLSDADAETLATDIAAAVRAMATR